MTNNNDRLFKSDDWTFEETYCMKCSKKVRGTCTLGETTFYVTPHQSEILPILYHYQCIQGAPTGGGFIPYNKCKHFKQLELLTKLKERL